MSWNVTLPRMVTWGVFKEKSSGRSFHFYNTHFAHRGADAEARVQSARVLAERLRALPQNAQIMVTGDFNTDAGTEPYNILTQILKDARKTVPAPSGPEGTFHGFSGNPGKARIDWILYRGLQPLSLEAITMSRDGRYPSDHFPVIAIFKL
jgi:endonuclease/exonuclease/phosphatase family metal-dependent hydrolase